MSNRELYHWWTEKSDKKVADSIHSYLKYLDKHQDYRNVQNTRNMRLYGNFDINGLQAYAYLRKESSYNTQNRVTMNIVQSMVDTVTSKITKNKPAPTFLTAGGDWTMQQRAKSLTKFVEGQFYATDFYEKRAVAFKDSCIFGTGFNKIYKHNRDIKVERVFPHEIVIDDSEGFYGHPRQMHQIKWIHKDILIAMYPKHQGAIETVNENAKGYNSFAPKHTDLVLCVESWKLPSDETVMDGRHVISIQNAVLMDEPYQKEYFPFVVDRWNTRPFGYFGQGIAEQLQGLQLEINKLLRTIQVSMHLVSIPKIFVEMGSQVATPHLNNKIGGIIKYSGTPPTPGPLANVPGELFSHLDRLYQRAFEIVGVSQLSAQSTKPAGLDSGKALREFNDIETERFMNVGLRYEKGFLDAARIMIDLAKEIDEEYKDQGGYQIKVHGRDSIQTMKWEQVKIEEDQYVMKMFPTSSLSSTPAGRLQDVQELLQAGFIDIEEGKKLLDFPDLEQYYNMSTAALRDIERQIELIMDESKYQTPEPFQNLPKGIEKFQSAYLFYKAQGAPEEKLELLRRWMTDAEDLLQQAAQPQQSPQPVAEPVQPPVDPVVDPAAVPQDVVDPEQL